MKKLAAMATRRGRDGKEIEARFVVESEIHDEELFGVNRVMKRKAREFKIHSKEHSAGGSKSDGADVEFRDRRPG